MTKPLLSVVIPAFNNGRTLGETLESVLAERALDFELIVADHSSTDDTAAVMSRYAGDARVTLLTTPAGGGAPANWNRVTSAARGEYIKLVCGDDVVRPGTLARQVALLEETGAVMTACRRDIVDSRGAVLFRDWGLRGLPSRAPGTQAVRRAVRAGSNLFGEPASVTMRRSVLVQAGGWMPDFPYLIDQATYSNVLLKGDFVADRATGATFRMSTSQWSVVLTRSQAGQARAFHQYLHALRPDVVSRWDVMTGNARAALMARARRLSYQVLKRRMK